MTPPDDAFLRGEGAEPSELARRQPSPRAGIDGPATDAGAVRRICSRCARTFAGKAGRLVSGQPVCQSCGNALRAPVPCVACGNETKYPRRSEIHGSLVCVPCATADTHATCRRCRRHRRVAARDADGRPLCRACSAPTPVTHRCPDCHETVPGAGRALCFPCTFARKAARTAGQLAPGIDPGWARDLFIRFCASPELRTTGWTASRQLRGYATFFSDLGRDFGSPGELSQEALLHVYGAEVLRRQFQPVRFLARTLGLVWGNEVAERVKEEARTAATMREAAGQPWAQDLADFRRSLSGGRPVAPRTVRMYVAAAAALLARSGVERATGLTPAHVARHLRRVRGQAASLQRFLTWVTSEGGPAFPRTRKRPGRPRARERLTLRRAAALLGYLEAITDPRRRRALLAAGISVVHGVPLSRVLLLERPDVSEAAGKVRLWQGEAQVTLAEPLAGAFRRLTAGSGYPFEGRNSVQPLSAPAVAYQLRTLGLLSVTNQLRSQKRARGRENKPEPRDAK